MQVFDFIGYQSHTVAPQKHLEGHRITRKGDTSSKMVAGGKQCVPRSTTTPTKTCSAVVYRRIKRRVGRSLKRSLCKGNLVPSRKQATHKLSGTKVVVFFVVADKLSRLGQTIQTEWSLLPEVFQPQIDLFATRFNKLAQFVSPVHTPRPGQSMHSACHGRIWIRMPSHQQPSWA